MPDKRDLVADKATCDAATPGPWGIAYHEGHKEHFFPIVTGCGAQMPHSQVRGNQASNSDADAAFIATARAAWPHAIDRAIAAETHNARLRDQLNRWLQRFESLAPLCEYYYGGELFVEEFCDKCPNTGGCQFGWSLAKHTRALLRGEPHA